MVMIDLGKIIYKEHGIIGGTIMIMGIILLILLLIFIEPFLDED